MIQGYRKGKDSFNGLEALGFKESILLSGLYFQKTIYATEILLSEKGQIRKMIGIQQAWESLLNSAEQPIQIRWEQGTLNNPKSSCLSISSGISVF